MFLWPANSALFWLAIVAGFALFFRFGLFSRRAKPIPGWRLLILGVLAAVAVAITAIIPGLVYSSLTGGTFAGDWLDISMWCTAVALAAMAILLACWGLFSDRDRGRKRCPRCWYDMAGSPTLKCPECGRAAATERSLHKTRRRWWGVAAAMLLLILAGGTAVGPTLRYGGWPALLPDVVILAAIPYSPMNVALDSEISFRLKDHKFLVRVMSGGARTRVAHWAAQKSLALGAPGIALDRSLALVSSSKDITRYETVLKSLAEEGNRYAFDILFYRSPEPPALMEVIEALLVHTSAQQRQMGVHALISREFKQPSERELPPRLLELARSADPVIRAAALHSLNYVPMSPTVSALIDDSLADASLEVRVAVLNYLGQTQPGDPRLPTTLLAWLNDTDVKARTTAAWHITQLGPRTDELVAALPDVILTSFNPKEQDMVFTALAESPATGAQCAAIFGACSTNTRLRPFIVTAFRQLGAKIPDALPRMRELEAQWRAEGDTANADALAAAIKVSEQHFPAEHPPLEPP